MEGNAELDFDDFDHDYDEDDFEGDQSEEEYEDGQNEDDEEDETVEPGDGSLESTFAEQQIEGDFERLVQSIRNSDSGASENASGILSQVWDFDSGAGEAQGEGEGTEDVTMDLDAQFQEDLRGASGVGRRKTKGKGGKRRRRTDIPLSHQVRALIGEANQAYVDGDLPLTTQLLLEVLRIEPRALPAWSVLAQVHRDLNNHPKALQLAIMGAHLQHDADEWARLGRESREMGLWKQAAYCFGKRVRLEPADVEAQWERAEVAKAVGDLRQARDAYLAILKYLPHDLIVLNELRYVLIELDQLPLCAQLYQRAFDHHLSSLPVLDPNLDPLLAPDPTQSGFTEMELLVLADLYNALGQHVLAIRAIKRGVRFLSRAAPSVGAIGAAGEETADDSEFDPPGMRRVAAGGLERDPKGKGKAREDAGGELPISVNARHRLAIARLKMGDVEEGKVHANIILTHDIADYAPLFTELADAFFERGMYAEARGVYEVLGSDASTSSIRILMQTAACRRMMGDLKEAAEVYHHLIKADNTNNDAKMQLAEIYEITHEPRKALDLVHQVLASRKRRGAGEPGSQAERDMLAADGDGDTSLFPESGGGTQKKRGGTSTSTTARRGHNNASNQNQNQTNDARRLSKKEVKELETQKEKEMVASYARVKELWVALGMGKGAVGVGLGEETVDEKERERMESEWLLEAEKMVEAFRETRMLFTTTNKTLFQHIRKKKDEEREQQDMADRLELELEQESVARSKSRAGEASLQLATAFRGITFDEWLTLFMEYAFLLTRRGQFSLAEEVLQHLLWSAAYRTQEAQESIRLALITCGIHACQFNTVVEQTRKFINGYQFNNDPLRMLLASTASGLKSTDAFLATKLQKHLFREMKLADAAVKGGGGKDAVRWNGPTQRWVMDRSAPKGEEGAEEDEEDGAAAAAGSNDKKRKPTEKPTMNNPVNVALYGMLCIGSKSYQSAIFYLLHAYDYAQEDPMVCLLLAIASIGRAMQRQSDNRNFLVVQGAAFLTQYRERRGAFVEGMEEIEYNFGRWFHQLGLLTNAVHHYERVLDIVDRRRQENGDEDFGLARDAAYNLSSIFAITGAVELAEDLYERWLTI